MCPWRLLRVDWIEISDWKVLSSRRLPERGSFSLGSRGCSIFDRSKEGHVMSPRSLLHRGNSTSCSLSTGNILRWR